MGGLAEQSTASNWTCIQRARISPAHCFLFDYFFFPGQSWSVFYKQVFWFVQTAALSTLSVSGYSNFHYFIVVWSSTLLSQQLQRNTQLLPRCSLHLHSLICCSDSFFLSKAVKMMPVGRGIIKKLRKFNNLFKSEKKLKTEQQNRVRRQSICVGDLRKWRNHNTCTAHLNQNSLPFPWTIQHQASWYYRARRHDNTPRGNSSSHFQQITYA